MKTVLALLLCLLTAAWMKSATAGVPTQLGTEFSDCPQCPTMVVVPAGSYTMGSNESPREQPQHRVEIAKPFAVGKYNISFAEWDACLADGACGGYRPDDLGVSRKSVPVFDVSWYDAQSYVTWLGKKSGKRYRLLSEAEWEYVARAGTTTRYWWGDELGKGHANCTGCIEAEDLKAPKPSGSFPANPFGLFDTAGNMSVWIQDFWHKDYNGAPVDGRAWEEGGDQRRRVWRNGSWQYDEKEMSVSYRNADGPAKRNWRIGIRVARDLD